MDSHWKLSAPEDDSAVRTTLIRASNPAEFGISVVKLMYVIITIVGTMLNVPVDILPVSH